MKKRYGLLETTSAVMARQVYSGKADAAMPEQVKLSEDQHPQDPATELHQKPGNRRADALGEDGRLTNSGCQP